MPIVALFNPASSPACQSSVDDLEPASLRPADVHPVEHLGPVLRLRAAGARVDLEDRVGAVVLPRQKRRQLGLLDPRFQSGHRRREVRKHVLALARELVKRPRIVEQPPEGSRRLDALGQARPSLLQDLRAARIAPHRRAASSTSRASSSARLRSTSKEPPERLHLFGQRLDPLIELLKVRTRHDAPPPRRNLGPLRTHASH